MSAKQSARRAPSKPQERAYHLGPISHFGITEAWQVALLIPRKIIDLETSMPSAESAVGQGRCVLHLTITSQPTGYYRGAPRVAFRCTDPSGAENYATIFGDTKVWLSRLSVGQRIAAQVQVSIYNGAPSITIERLIEGDESRIEVVYPEKTRVMTSAEVAQAIAPLLDAALPRAARHIEGLLAPVADPALVLKGLGCPGWTTELVLAQAHRPASAAYGERAIRVLRQMAAICAFAKGRHEGVAALKARRFTLPTLERRLTDFPFTPSEDQRAAVYDIAFDLASGRPSRRLISADVGSGKTAVYLSVAIAVSEAGGRVAIMLPNTVLANQVADEARRIWPEHPIACVTGDNDGDCDAPLVIGTQAIIHRATRPFDLVVLDEEQKFSAEQKRALIDRCGHQLLASATCMPRSLALANLGTTSISKLRPHTPKTFFTTLWTKEQRVELFSQIRNTVRSGERVLVVYPVRDASDGQDGGRTAAIHSVETAAQTWEGMFPGKVRTLTGDSSEADKERVMADLRDGIASILLSTTVVEVGVNIPKLTRVVIIHPERHGLNTLHQLRGRGARNGGEAYCDLYMPVQPAAESVARLEFFASTSDGFKIAEYDLRRRGMGDLGENSVIQSGADNTILYGQHISTDEIEQVAPLIEQLRRRGAN